MPPQAHKVVRNVMCRSHRNERDFKEFLKIDSLGTFQGQSADTCGEARQVKERNVGGRRDLKKEEGD